MTSSSFSRRELNGEAEQVFSYVESEELEATNKFSVREVKLLRKLINNQKKRGYVNYSEIHDQFPGKSLKLLEKKYNEKYDYLTKKKGN